MCNGTHNKEILYPTNLVLKKIVVQSSINHNNIFRYTLCSFPNSIIHKFHEIHTFREICPVNATFIFLRKKWKCSLVEVFMLYFGITLQLLGIFTNS